MSFEPWLRPETSKRSARPSPQFRATVFGSGTRSSTARARFSRLTKPLACAAAALSRAGGGRDHGIVAYLELEGQRHAAVVLAALVGGERAQPVLGTGLIA